MAKFLVKNVSVQDGIYRVEGKDVILPKKDHVILPFPPEFHSAELKITQIEN